MKIKSVAVLGAGAVGSYVIWGLSQKPEVRLGVIAEGERADCLRKNGCAINGRIYHPEVWSPEEAIEPQSGFVYHRPVKTEMITKVRCIK